jgi:hypothetical protein
VLPEFADMGVAETPVDAGFAPGLRDKVREVSLDVFLDCRTGTPEAMQPFHFIGDELKIRRVPQRQEAFWEFDDLGRPCRAMAAAARTGLIAEPVLEPGCPQFFEPDAASTQPGCGAGGIKSAAIEVAHDTSDKAGR